MKTSFAAIAILLIVIVDLFYVIETGKVQYQYKKYTYRKKRDDKIYKNIKQPCEVNPDCLAKRGADQAICIRKCISEFCYQDIYAADELEEGEIDSTMEEDFIDKFGGPHKAIKVNEISGLYEYLQSIDWTEPWFSALGIFHVSCAILTVLTRKTGVIQAVYFAALMVLVLCAEYINKWAAENWSMFSKQQYFDSNGLFISVVFSVPLLINCLVMVVSWLWDVGLLIASVKELKIRQQTKLGKKNKEKDERGQSSAEVDNGATETKKDK